VQPREAPSRADVRDAADRHPQIAKLEVRDVYARALRLYRREPIRVSVTAVLLLGPGLILGIGSGVFADRLADDTAGDRFLAALVLALVGAVLGTLGTVAYSGVLDELVGAVIRGETPPPIGTAVRSLPFWRLIVADLYVAVSAGVGFFLGVLPGIVVLSLFCTVGPIVNIELHRPLAAIRRAVGLTSRHLFLTLMTVGIPLTLEIAAHEYLLHLKGDVGTLIEFLVGLPLILTIGAAVGLNEVVLAYALLARSPDSSVAEQVLETAPSVEADTTSG
jgi:hypothetical protein